MRGAPHPQKVTPQGSAAPERQTTNIFQKSPAQKKRNFRPPQNERAGWRQPKKKPSLMLLPLRWCLCFWVFFRSHQWYCSVCALDTEFFGSVVDIFCFLPRKPTIVYTVWRSTAFHEFVISSKTKEKFYCFVVFIYSAFVAVLDTIFYSRWCLCFWKGFLSGRKLQVWLITNNRSQSVPKWGFSSHKRQQASFLRGVSEQTILLRGRGRAVFVRILVANDLKLDGPFGSLNVFFFSGRN